MFEVVAKATGVEENFYCTTPKEMAKDKNVFTHSKC